MSTIFVSQIEAEVYTKLGSETHRVGYSLLRTSYMVLDLLYSTQSRVEIVANLPELQAKPLTLTRSPPIFAPTPAPNPKNALLSNEN